MFRADSLSCAWLYSFLQMQPQASGESGHPPALERRFTNLQDLSWLTVVSATTEARQSHLSIYIDRVYEARQDTYMNIACTVQMDLPTGLHQSLTNIDSLKVWKFWLSLLMYLPLSFLSILPFLKKLKLNALVLLLLMQKLSSQGCDLTFNFCISARHGKRCIGKLP